MAAAVSAEFIISIVLMPIILALLGGPVMYFIKRFDDHNTHQHNKNLEALKHIHDNIEHVKESVHSMKLDVTGVKMDVSDVKMDVRDVQSGVKSMQKDVRVLDDRLTKHIEDHKHFDWNLVKKERSL
jgi:peptidoglycan hydrolase CwlO-like protein